MNVALLTGSLEPERDGVGDYTRYLAVDARRLGVSCRMVALADRRAAAPQRSCDDGVEALRLPSAMAWPDRIAAARAFLDEAPVDWVSLQFVPYSFHRHGVAASLARAIARLSSGTRLQVMFHEIWIQGTESWRRRIVSAAQRRVVIRIGRAPGAVVHTSNDTYRCVLRRHGVHAETLPLFGNVPPVASDAAAWLRPLLSAVGCDALEANRARWWLVALFGTLHPVWPPEPLLAELEAAAAGSSRRVAVISIGDIGAGEGLWANMAASYGTRMPMLRLGHRPVREVSEVLNTVDFGVATTPLPLIGKSGSAAAMFDHGLPVIVNREDCLWPAEPATDERERALVIRMGAGFSARLQQARRLPAAWKRPAITRQWVGALGAAASASSAWSS